MYVAWLDHHVPSMLLKVSESVAQNELKYVYLVLFSDRVI